MHQATISLGPHRLWASGDTTLLTRRQRIAIVGTRSPTEAGCVLVRRVVATIAAHAPEAVIVSGLARGIDAEAHRAALRHGLAAIAVLGFGMAHHSPASTKALRDDVLASGGLLLSAYAPDTPPTPHQFRERNAVLASCATALVLSEAQFPSGTALAWQHARTLGLTIVGIAPSATHLAADPQFALLRQAAALGATAWCVDDAGHRAALRAWMIEAQQGEPTA